MNKRFSFDINVRKYLSDFNKTSYPRLQAWEFLWDYVQRNQTWKSLIATEKEIELTALHIGFFLANWGMFRGGGYLINFNLDFFKTLSVYLFSKLPQDFWNLSFEDFNPNDIGKSNNAQSLFDSSIERINNFEADIISWTSTLTTKLLMGIWGNCPANDRYFRIGLSIYAKNNPNVKLRGRTEITGRFISDMYSLVEKMNWNLNGYKTKAGKNMYPPGKLIDMAFFQYGYDLSD